MDRCTFHQNGCSLVLRRLEKIQHIQTCPFNFDKYGKFIYFCPHFGHQGCDFKVNNGNGSAYLVYLREFHKFSYTQSPQIIHELGGLTQEEMLVMEKKYFHKIIIDFGDNFIVTFSTKTGKYLSNTSVWFPKCSSDPKSEVVIRYQFLTQGHEAGTNSLLENWSQPWFFRDLDTTSGTVGQVEFLSHQDIDGLRMLAGEDGTTLKLMLQLQADRVNHPVQQVPIFKSTPSLQQFCWNREFENSSVKTDILKVFVLAMKKGWDLDVTSLVQRLYLSKRLANDEDPMMMMWIDHALLFTAAEYGTPEALEVVLNLIQANLDVVDDRGASPLVLTMFTNDAEKAVLKAQLLIGRGADTSLLTHSGTSILQFAVAAHNFLAVQEFLQKGADPNHKRNDGATPLLLCFKRMPAHNNLDASLAIADLLMDKGAKPLPESVIRKDTVLNFIRTQRLKERLEKYMIPMNAAGEIEEEGVGSKQKFVL